VEVFLISLFTFFFYLIHELWNYEVSDYVK
jgi:hypothetical protein